MRKSDLIILYLLALLVLSITLIFQSDPGYMDSEFYYLGARQLISGKLNIPVIWNYLSGPINITNPIFTYWMPFPSLLSAFSMLFFGTSFAGSRILLLLIAGGLAPLTYWLSYKFNSNRFTSYIAGAMAIFSGFYLKYLTIPETILPYMFLGTLFFYNFAKVFKKQNYEVIKPGKIFFLGVVTGLLHLTRVDGIIFLILGIGIILYIYFMNLKKDRQKIDRDILIFIGSYCLIMGFWFASNLQFYGSIFSPASSKVMWIASYDDTFIYPASELTLNYWLENGISLRPAQILAALKLNLGTITGVHMMIIGLPLFIIGIKRNFKNDIMRIGIIIYVLIFILMTLVFPLSGARGGFLHSGSAVQILIWIMMADGLQGFLEWGIRKRNWQMKRSQKMFGSALIGIFILFTMLVYKNDVLGDSREKMKWSKDYSTYERIEAIISQTSEDKTEVIMINNPLGYYYSTGRWGLVVPNAGSDQFLKVINQFNVKFVVLDNNLPEKFDTNQFSLMNKSFELIQELPSGIKIYALKN